MNIYSIYRLTNLLNQKVYIGFTSRKNPRYRWTEHISESKTLKASKSFSIHYAIAKYGVLNFTFEVIYQSKDRDHTLNVMEKAFIAEHRSFGFNGRYGYNESVGGTAPQHTEATREKMSKSQVGRKHSEEHNRRVSEAMKGKTHTEETRHKMSESRKNQVTVAGITYQGIQEAADALGIPRSTFRYRLKTGMYT